MKTAGFLGIIALVLILTTCDSEAYREYMHTHIWEYDSRGASPTCSEDGENFFICTDFIHGTDECRIKNGGVSNDGWGPRLIARSVPRDPDGHDPLSISWERTLNPTCTETGSDAGVCSDCNKTFTRILAPEHKGDWTITPATCTAVEIKKRTCTLCGQDETVYGDALGHDWRRLEVISQPGCVFPGTQREKCDRCGIVQTFSISPLHHKWEKRTNQSGWFCSRCGAWSLISAHG